MKVPGFWGVKGGYVAVTPQKVVVAPAAAEHVVPAAAVHRLVGRGAHQPVVARLFNPVQDHVLDELLTKVPGFRQAYMEDGLEVEHHVRIRLLERDRDAG